MKEWLLKIFPEFDTRKCPKCGHKVGDHGYSMCHHIYPIPQYVGKDGFKRVSPYDYCDCDMGMADIRLNLRG